MGYSRNAALLRVDLPSPSLHLRRAPGGDRHGHRAGHGHRPSSAWAASAADHLRLHPSGSHAHHRGPRLLRSPWPRSSTAHRRGAAPRPCRGRAPHDGRGGLMSDWDIPTLHWPAVVGWFHHQCQLDWQLGHPLPLPTPGRALARRGARCAGGGRRHRPRTRPHRPRGLVAVNAATPPGGPDARPPHPLAIQPSISLKWVASWPPFWRCSSSPSRPSSPTPTSACARSMPTCATRRRRWA